MRRGNLLVCDQNRIVEMDAATAATIGMIVGYAGHEVCQMPDGSRATAEQGLAMLQAVQVTGSMTVGDYWLIGPRGRVYVHQNRLVAHTFGGRVFVSCSIKYQSFALDSLTPGDSRGIFGSVTQRSRMSTEPNETIVALFPRWSRYMKSMCDFGAQHISKSQADVAAIAEQAGWIYPHEMNARGLSDWAMTYIESLSARGLSGRKRAKNMASSARSFAAWCKQERIIAEHDLGDAKLPTVRKSHRGKGARAFSLDEVKRLILAAEEMEAKSMRTGRYGPNRSVLYCFLAHTGLRYLESMRLTWNDADLDTAILHVRLDKAGRGDSIPMSVECVQALRDLRAFRATDTASGHIFRKVSHHTLVADMERAGIPGRAEGKAGEWHRFRKFMVTERLRSGQDPKKVQRLARHATLELTTGIYNDLEMDELRGTAESFGRLNGFLEKNSCPSSTEPIYSPSHTATEPVVPSHAPNIQTPPEREAPPLCDYSGKLDRPAPVESGCPGRSAEGHSHPGSTAAQWSRGESNPRPNRTHNRTGSEHGHPGVSALSHGQGSFWVFPESADVRMVPGLHVGLQPGSDSREPRQGTGGQQAVLPATAGAAGRTDHALADGQPGEEGRAWGGTEGTEERRTGSSPVRSVLGSEDPSTPRRLLEASECSMVMPSTPRGCSPLETSLLTSPSPRTAAANVAPPSLSHLKEESHGRNQNCEVQRYQVETVETWRRQVAENDSVVEARNGGDSHHPRTTETVIYAHLHPVICQVTRDQGDDNGNGLRGRGQTQVAPPAPVAQREHLLSGESKGHPDGEGARSIRAGDFDPAGVVLAGEIPVRSCLCSHESESAGFDLGRKECDNTVTIAFVGGGDICGAASSESGWVLHPNGKSGAERTPVRLQQATTLPDRPHPAANPLRGLPSTQLTSTCRRPRWLAPGSGRLAETKAR